MRRSFLWMLATLGGLGLSVEATAETYAVGPGRPYGTIQEVLAELQPGDVVEVDGGHTYPGDLWFEPEHSGTPASPVTIRGLYDGSTRPVLQGVGTEQWHDMVVLLYANHLVFEGFEVIGDGNEEHSCIVHKADGVVVRDVVVHGCGRHGLLGADDGSGSLTLELSEFYANGSGLYHHQIYMATDESMYPGSIFRMQHCFVHDAAGGNNVKSRSERNEIYYNWIEGAVYHELDLIGPDGQDPGLAREDSDVVGNVLLKNSQSEWRIARIGGDGTGSTAGHYRFVNNTIILGPASETAFGLQQEVASLEAHNNVFYRQGAATARLWRHTEPVGAAPELIGSHNWVQDGWTDVPAEWSATTSGADPGWEDLASYDLRPQAGSVLLDAGTDATVVGSVPSPLPLPELAPPTRALLPVVLDRNDEGAPDIGAYALQSGTPTGGGGSAAGGGGAGAAGAAGPGAEPADEGGCGCRTARRPSSAPALWGVLVASLVLGWRRRSNAP